MKRFRSLPLRSRLAMLTATAVAVAVAVMAVAAWLLTYNQLRSSLDDALQSNRPGPPDMIINRIKGGECTPQPEAADTRFGNPFGGTVQILLANGTTCILEGESMLRTTAADRAVAAGTQRTALHDSTTKAGTSVRVFTMQLEGYDAAVLTARPLTEVESPLNTLALVLLIAAGIGVVGAASAGLIIARAGLKPVDRLTDAVEHVARTEDLTVRIPVDGEDEIARLSRSFNTMTASLASSRELQQQLIADAGHELRTPLTSMRTNIELLERSEATGRPLPPDDRKALMVSVKAQMSELASLIGDLQELSRPDAAPGSGPLQIVALHEVLDSALMRARLRGRDLTIKADVAPWFVQGEPAALQRAVVNLLDNAVKFSPAGGIVEVILSQGELTVRDHGPGIAPEDLPHVFERFWRSASARSLPGSGLGLSIVARTVQQSGGAVSLQPAPGGGTLAHVRLPGVPTPPPELD